MQSRNFVHTGKLVRGFLKILSFCYVTRPKSEFTELDDDQGAYVVVAL